MKCRLSTQEYDIQVQDDDEKGRLAHITNTYQQVLEAEDIEDRGDIGLDWQQFLKFIYDVAVKQRKFDISWFENKGNYKMGYDEMKDCNMI